MKRNIVLAILFISLSVNWLCDAKSIIIRHQKLDENDAMNADRNQLKEIKNLRKNLLLQNIIEDIYEQTLDDLLPQILENRKQNGLQASLLVIYKN